VVRRAREIEQRRSAHSILEVDERAFAMPNSARWLHGGKE
jgi:hypothetical protein